MLADHDGFLTWTCSIAGFILIIGLICSAIDAYQSKVKRKKAEQDAANRRREDDLQRALQEEQAAMESEFAARQAEAEAQQKSALAKAMAQLREAAEERFRPAINAEGMDALDQKLREAQMIFSRTGRVLTVRAFVVPTGWLVIEWMLEPSLPLPLKVTCRRDGTVVFVEHAYKGNFGDILIRGKEYAFSFQAMDGNRDREDGFRFVVKAPTPAQWKRKINETPAIEDAGQRRAKIAEKIKVLTTEDEAWEQGRRAGHEQIDTAGGPDIEKKRRKARLDAQIARERDFSE